MNSLPRIFIIAGSTGVGKTEIAAAVAARCAGEIIGADAFQIYRGMDLLTAKPPLPLREKIPHHLIGTIPISQQFDVAQYLDLASRCIREIHARGKLPIVTGGTGLYVRALTHGLSELPGANPELRAVLETLSLEALQHRLEKLDPDGATRIDRQNRRRVVRAIEVCELTGKPFSSFQIKWTEQPRETAGVLLTRDRADLHARINRRVGEMFEAGLLDEVRDLPPTGPTAGQAIGLAEARACLGGEISLEECIARIQQATRQYAKRQMTWFRRETNLETIHLPDTGDLEPAIERIAAIAQRERFNK